ncbi:Mov34/MPN/PAD-1 family protein [Burkholderia pseudomallei]|uniref:Mov34/MPN/PAD-1 family protein n=1 Tax=Burkholderia pseudomallei TaxID=28450 RepID=UPI002952CCEC|nr:Mov34/MPN/PAD-1 family protein [Burkholderia pseudomallei]
MASLIATLVRFALGPRPEIFCDSGVWNAGVAELKQRAGGRRESGAFLLGTSDGARTIEEFVFYDDIDPNALRTGIVEIDGRRLGDLWTHCRKTGRSVIADVHVHPGGFQQSPSDQDNPIVAEIGHIAIILPDYAASATRPGSIGVHQYLGSRRWRDRSFERPSPFHVGWWPRWR